MYDSKKVWYNKLDVLNIFPINERTYFRRLKKINKLTNTMFQINNQGKKSTLIYFQDLLHFFEINRRPSDLTNKLFRHKYIGTSKWDYIGNIIPGHCEISTLKYKLRFIYKLLKEKDKNCVLFYSIENNTRDQFFHSHFLIKTTLQKSDIYNVLTFCSEENNSKETRIHLEKYNYEKHHFSGSFYSFKMFPNPKGEMSIFDELLFEL
jgi:hypothetical protein